MLVDFSLNMTQESFQNLEKKQGKEFLQWHGHSVTTDCKVGAEVAH